MWFFYKNTHWKHIDWNQRGWSWIFSCFFHFQLLSYLRLQSRGDYNHVFMLLIWLKWIWILCQTKCLKWTAIQGAAAYEFEYFVKQNAWNKVQKLDYQFTEFMTKKFITRHKYRMSSRKCPKSSKYIIAVSP